MRLVWKIIITPETSLCGSFGKKNYDVQDCPLLGLRNRIHHRRVIWALYGLFILVHVKDV